MKNNHDVDDQVDIQISECLSAESPHSFFLYAGAGSGKTKSLVLAIKHALKTRGRELAVRGQKIAVITYTNAAADEITSRISSDQLVTVSTIHSFAWNLICGFQEDIRNWLKIQLAESIEKLESFSSKPGTKKEQDRLFRLQRDKDLANEIDNIRKFTYNPASENREKSALNHSQVISLTAYLLNSKPLFAQILVTKHPIIFIDESQDTNKTLMEAFLLVASEKEAHFTLGLFGDTMQQIYSDGKSDLESSIPSAWAKPVKVMNHRSAERIVQLNNRIRENIDSHQQLSRTDRGTGIARLFIAEVGSRPDVVETTVAKKMAEITLDEEWRTPASEDYGADRAPAVKRLILEHSMAAQRFGFANVYKSLKVIAGHQNKNLDGSVPELNVFSNHVAKLIKAHKQADVFTIARILRENSPLMSQDRLESISPEPGDLRSLLSNCNSAVEQLTGLWSDGAVPNLLQVANVLNDTGLFVLSSPVKAVLSSTDKKTDDDASSYELDAWKECLSASFDQLLRYDKYFSGTTPFATHQGVKGLEFPRVMAIISDGEAKGFMFSYEKLLGAKQPTAADITNASEGKDSSLDRTRRLMYVICSRASESLAIVAYTSNPVALREFAIKNEWFNENEVVTI